MRARIIRVEVSGALVGSMASLVTLQLIVNRTEREFHLWATIRGGHGFDNLAAWARSPFSA